MRRLAAITLFSAVMGLSVVAGARAGDANQAVETAPQAIVVAADDDPVELHDDLNELADTWARDGGIDDFPFWERAWRRWRAGRLAGSGLRSYSVAYGTMLQQARDDLDDVSTNTDGAAQVKQLLLDAIDARVEALGTLNDYIDAQLDQATDIDGSELPEVRQKVFNGINDSYASTREAMNTSQALLDQVGQERIAEDAFL